MHSGNLGRTAKFVPVLEKISHQVQGGYKFSDDLIDSLHVVTNRRTVLGSQLFVLFTLRSPRGHDIVFSCRLQREKVSLLDALMLRLEVDSPHIQPRYVQQPSVDSAHLIRHEEKGHIQRVSIGSKRFSICAAVQAALHKLAVLYHASDDGTLA